MLRMTRWMIPSEIERAIRIFHLSDLHGTWFGERQEKLVGMAREVKPDAIAMTGDFIDDTCDERAAVLLIEEMARIAPVYCVTGNHEEREMAAGSGSYERLTEAIERTENAHLLRGKTVCLTDGIALTGADDCDFVGGRAAYPGYLAQLSGGAEGKFRILLAHRPEMFDSYAAAGFDLSLTGHAHGGQIRLPLIGGLFAPGQGIFPRYTGGVYVHESGMRMFVNRGLGNSVPVPRVFNSPEAAVIEIGGNS